MPKYFFVARDVSGKRKEGVLEASSNADAVINIRKQQFLPIDIRLINEAGLVSITRQKKIWYRKNVSLVELALFSRQFATMMDAGIPVIETLEDLSEQTINKYFSSVMISMKNNIREGKSLTQAMADFPSVFSPLYVAMVQAGEVSGNLVEVMQELSSELEDQLTLIRKVRQALSYPTVILLFFIGVVAFVFFFLIPRFQAIFSSFGAQLPLLTRIIMEISQFGLKYFIPVLIFIILFVIFIALYHRTRPGRLQIDSIKLKFPIFGQLLLKICLSRFSRSLSTLLKGGVTIIQALEIVSLTSGNAVIESTLRKVKNGIIKGELLGKEMKKYRVFPAMLVRMISVGEETGKTEEMLNRVSKFFRDEVDATLNILASLIEPILIIGLGIIVGTVVLAIYFPIFKLASTIK